MTDMMRAVLAMTESQMLATWAREQRYNRDRGLPHYTVLRDAATGKVKATIDD